MTKLIALVSLLLSFVGCGGGVPVEHHADRTPSVTQTASAPELHEKRWFVEDGVDVRKFWDGEAWRNMPPGPPPPPGVGVQQ